MSVDLEQIEEAKKIAENAEQLKQASEDVKQALSTLNNIAGNIDIVVRFDIDRYDYIDFHVNGISEDDWKNSSSYC